METKKMTPSRCEAFLALAVAQINSVLPSGITAVSRGASYTPHSAILSIEIAYTDAQGRAMDEYSQALIEHGAAYGLLPDDLGRTFAWNGVRYRITGLKMANHKYPVLVSRVSDDDKRKFPAETVRKALGRNNVASIKLLDALK